MDSKVYNADCLAILPQIEDESIDLVLADPPYGTTQCKYDCVIPIDELWNELKRVVKPTGSIILFSKMPFTARLIASNLEGYHQEIIWVKNVASNFLNANKMALDVHENILIFRKIKPGTKVKRTYNPQLTPGTPYKVKRSGKDDSGDCYGKIKTRTDTTNNGTRKPTTVVYYDRVANNVRCHPSQKPCTLLDYLVRTYSNEGDTVLDFAMGSGSTGRSAITNARKFVGIEKDKETFDTAVHRLSMVEDEWDMLRKSLKKRSGDDEVVDEPDAKKTKQSNE